MISITIDPTRGTGGTPSRQTGKFFFRTGATGQYDLCKVDLRFDTGASCTNAWLAPALPLDRSRDTGTFLRSPTMPELDCHPRHLAGYGTAPAFHTGHKGAGA